MKLQLVVRTEPSTDGLIIYISIITGLVHAKSILLQINQTSLNIGLKSRPRGGSNLCDDS